MFFRASDNVDTNGEDTSSLSSEEEKDRDTPVNKQRLMPGWTSVPQSEAPPSSDSQKEEKDNEEDSCLPTIYFSHTVEPKKVRMIDDFIHSVSLASFP